MNDHHTMTGRAHAYSTISASPNTDTSNAVNSRKSRTHPLARSRGDLELLPMPISGGCSIIAFGSTQSHTLHIRSPPRSGAVDSARSTSPFSASSVVRPYSPRGASGLPTTPGGTGRLRAAVRVPVSIHRSAITPRTRRSCAGSPASSPVASRRASISAYPSRRLSPLSNSLWTSRHCRQEIRNSLPYRQLELRMPLRHGADQLTLRRPWGSTISHGTPRSSQRHKDRQTVRLTCTRCGR